MDTLGIVPDEHANSQPANTPPAKVPVTRVSYNGKAGQVFRLHLMNLLMNIITIGIYSFWGKTRIRKYMTSHISILNDRLEYTGTGKELLFGWMKAMLIFMPILVMMSIPVVNIIGFIFFFGILSLAIYLALRYRLSRTKWRGIKFNLAGSLKEYFFLSIRRTAINAVTFGWKIPKSDIMLWSYMANNMSYGDMKFSYEGDAKRLQKIHLITLSVFLLAFIIPIGLGGVLKGQELIKHARERSEARKAQTIETAPSLDTNAVPATQINQVAPQAGEANEAVEEPVTEPVAETATESAEEPVAEESEGQIVEDKVENEVVAVEGAVLDKDDEPSEETIVGFVIAFYAFFGAAFIARLWYQAALWQERFRGLRLGGLRFKAEVTGGGLAKLFVTNILIVICTLGLGKPIAAHRTLRYYASNLRIGGDVNDLIAHQDKTLAKSGMGDALAADVGFDLGL